MNTLCVIPTYRCNITCQYCFNDTHENLAAGASRHGDVEFAGRIRTVCTALADHGLQRLSISGGEPLASKLTPFWLTSAEENNLKVRIITNLTLLPDYLEKRLDKRNDLELTVSLGGLDAFGHERFRQRFGATIDNLERLRRYGRRITISFVLDRHNASQITKVQDYCEQRNFNLALSPISPQGGGEAVADACLSRLSSDAWSNIEQQARSLELRVALSAIRAFHTGQLRVEGCVMRNSVVVLTPDGGLYGCFFRSDLCHGNLFLEDPNDVLRRLPANSREPAPCFEQKCLPILINH